MDPYGYSYSFPGTPGGNRPQSLSESHSRAGTFNFDDTSSIGQSSLGTPVPGSAGSSREREDGKHHVRVVVRVRPLNEMESERNDAPSIVCMEDKQTLQLNSTDGKNRPLTFNRVHSESATQEELFQECGVKDLLMQALEGYAVTIFAFGQTGSGKTFTITGPENKSGLDFQGIVPRSLHYIFDQISQRSDRQYTIRAAYLEIYNEQVQDLLNPSNSHLSVRWTPEKGFYVENLFVVECEVLDDCMAVLEEGLRNRTVASHALNEHSSRSHSIMTIYVDGDFVDPADGRVTKRNGKIHFVDLAGSEKVKESKATGETFNETLNINKSLLTLGKCISALADGKKRGGHIPYRDSKLTKLLADSLGGHGLALMIACVSPSSYCVAETMKTLRYADRAKRIKNKPIIQMDPREELILQLKKEVKTYKEENKRFREVLGEDQAEAILAPLRAAGFDTPSRLDSPSRQRRDTLPPLSPSTNMAAGTFQELQSTKHMLQEIMTENDQLKYDNTELQARLQQKDAIIHQLQSQTGTLTTKLQGKGAPSHPTDGMKRLTITETENGDDNEKGTQTLPGSPVKGSRKASANPPTGIPVPGVQGADKTSPAAVAANKQKLLKEVQQLDAEIRSMHNSASHHHKK